MEKNFITTYEQRANTLEKALTFSFADIKTPDDFRACANLLRATDSVSTLRKCKLLNIAQTTKAYENDGFKNLVEYGESLFPDLKRAQISNLSQAGALIDLDGKPEIPFVEPTKLFTILRKCGNKKTLALTLYKRGIFNDPTGEKDENGAPVYAFNATLTVKEIERRIDYALYKVDESDDAQPTENTESTESTESATESKPKKEIKESPTESASAKAQAIRKACDELRALALKVGEPDSVGILNAVIAIENAVFTH